ncbi:BRCT domain-containing protein, partial [Polaribacter sargassicola]|uniref:BRCT domain-containing protein n=1 Tax=Polaribacter sargassicola TaxID=2836891 RepID=UPI001F2BEFDE
MVFTGTLSRPREAWARALADAGFITGSVTKSCAVLIAEDPASQSGKAKTARAHGIPIVTEGEFIPVSDAYVAQRA